MVKPILPSSIEIHDKISFFLWLSWIAIAALSSAKDLDLSRRYQNISNNINKLGITYLGDSFLLNFYFSFILPAVWLEDPWPEGWPWDLPRIDPSPRRFRVSNPDERCPWQTFAGHSADGFGSTDRPPGPEVNIMQPLRDLPKHSWCLTKSVFHLPFLPAKNAIYNRNLDKLWEVDTTSCPVVILKIWPQKCHGVPVTTRWFPAPAVHKRSAACPAHHPGFHRQGIPWRGATPFDVIGDPKCQKTWDLAKASVGILELDTSTCQLEANCIIFDTQRIDFRIDGWDWNDIHQQQNYRP